MWHNVARYKEIPPLSPKDLERFHGHVERKGLLDCWPWTGTTSTAKYGAVYGVFRVGDGMFKPHRIAWVLTFGSIDAQLTIDHTCQNKLCMNPAHFELVPLTENVRRREAVRDRTRCKRGHAKTPLRPCALCQRMMMQIWKAKPEECRKGHPRIPLSDSCPTCQSLMSHYRTQLQEQL